ncbi:YciI family protein [Solirubrobacter soli]|uniref:YciI family protein n=1 Tax=Solirubrobacter soli TaxID=363832 RepID=UPI000409ADFA|nr:YciI family protein [Solirubrobacter soli]
MPRFMMFIYPNISDEVYAAGPTAEDVASMNRYNEELTKAGALLALDGLRPEASRVSTSGVTDGPFSEAKELVGGYWIIQAKDREEAIEWAKRCPQEPGSFVEVRQIFELSDFSEDLQDAAKLSSPPPNQPIER